MVQKYAMTAMVFKNCDMAEVLNPRMAKAKAPN